MTKKIVAPKGPELDSEYETEIEFTCPVRGLVKQKVKVKKYKSVEAKPSVDIKQSKNLADQLDVKYSGLMLDDNTVEDETDNEI